MRKIAPAPPAYREKTGITRFMLVASPEHPTYAKYVVVYAYMTPESDGASFTGWVYDDLAIAMEYCREHLGIANSAWTEIPDQIGGALDDWIAPVRIKQTPEGEHVCHEWQRLSPAGVWEDFAGSAGPYALQVPAPVAGLPSMQTLDEAAAEFFARLNQSKGPLVLYFHDPADGISQDYEHVIDEVERSIAVPMWRVDICKYLHACIQLGSRSIPSLMFCVDGKEVARPDAFWVPQKVIDQIKDLASRDA